SSGLSAACTAGRCAMELCRSSSVHRITEWPGLKRTTMLISFQPPAVCRVANQQTRLPRATSSLTTRFTNAMDIPVRFVEKNVKLRGKVHRVTERGLEVEHIPISSEGLLLVRLAGVELTPEGTVWLQRELKPSQMIWFQLLGREHLALECLVLVNKVNVAVRGRTLSSESSFSSGRNISSGCLFLGPPKVSFLSSTAQLCVCVSTWGWLWSGRSDGAQPASVCSETTAKTPAWGTDSQVHQCGGTQTPKHTVIQRYGTSQGWG
uniref:Uncharacterized protein n=1 Tax=Pavo cristatus TaxID=9049 RepID=A0A8C9F2W2_PAVCR